MPHRNLLRALAFVVLLLTGAACTGTAGQPANDANPGTGAQPAEDVPGAITESGYAAFDAIRAADDAVPADVQDAMAPYEGNFDTTITGSTLDECGDLEIFNRDREGVTFDFGDRGVTMSNESVNLDYQYFAATGEFCRPYAPGYVECLDFEAGSDREYRLRIYRETASEYMDDDEFGLGPAYALPCYAARHRLSQPVAAEPAAAEAGVEGPAAPDEPPVSEQAEPQPEAPAPDATSVTERTVVYRSSITGLSLTASGDFNVLDKGWSSGDAHVLADHMFAPVQVKAYPLATADLPGTTATEALARLFEQDYVDADEAYAWTVLEEPASLELGGESAARMLAERVEEGKETVWLLQLTVVRGPSLSSLVEGWITRRVEGLMPEMTDVADSLELNEPEATCYVGVKTEGESTRRRVRCDGVEPAAPALEADGYAIELGPTTWDACAAFMREQGERRW